MRKYYSKHNAHHQQTFGSMFIISWEAQLFLHFFQWLFFLRTYTFHCSTFRQLLSYWTLEFGRLYNYCLAYYDQLLPQNSINDTFGVSCFLTPNQMVTVLMDTPVATDIKLHARYDFVLYLLFTLIWRNNYISTKQFYLTYFLYFLCLQSGLTAFDTLEKETFPTYCSKFVFDKSLFMWSFFDGSIYFHSVWISDVA